LGDIKGGPAFTHLSYDDDRILRANLVRHHKASTRDRIVHPLLAEGLDTLFEQLDAAL
jgi:hypothetical protein